MNILVSFVSHQTIPNVKAIKLFRNDIDRYIFISTPFMEERNKTLSIIKASGIALKDYNIMLCDGDDLKDILDKLYEFDWNSTSRYIFHITCGTKLMAIAGWQMASVLDEVQVIYWPIRAKTFQVLSANGNQGKFPKLDYTLADITLREAILAQNIYFEKTKSPTKKEYNKSKRVMKSLIKYKDSKAVPEIKIAQAPTYSLPDKNFLSGGWFEEFLYGHFKEKYQLKSDSIAHGIKLFYNERSLESMVDNEIDLAFVIEDQLHIIEAKVYNQTLLNKNGVDRINNAVSKLANIADKFGIKAKYYIAMPGKLYYNGRGNFSSKKKQRIESIIKHSVIEEILDYDYFKKLNI